MNLDLDLDGGEVRITNPDKVLYPGRPGEPPVTKREHVEYHAAIAPWMLPYLRGRAVNLHRYPDGAHRKGFWHKERPDFAPDFVKGWHYEEADADETQCYAVLENVAAVAWVANFGAIEINPWTSCTSAPHEPSWALVDIDPGPATTFADVVDLARLYRAALDHLDVRSCPKVTGKRGIQVWVPIAGGYTFDDTRAWVETISRAIGSMRPELVSWAWQKRDREGKARLDYTQNAINKTLVSPFSTRPMPGATVSVPITWDELDDGDLAPDRWTIRDVFDRVEDAGDPLAPLVGVQQPLPPIT